MIRTLGGIAAGIALAIVIMVLVEAVGNQVAPPPMGLDLERPDAAVRMPFETLIFPVAGWLLGPLAGGVLAVRLSGRRWASWPVAGAVLIGAILQFAMAGHPVWMIASGIAAPIGGALLGQWIAGRRAASPAA